MADVTGNTNPGTFVATSGITQTGNGTAPTVNAIGDALNNGYNSPYVFSTDPNALASSWRSNGIPAGAQPNYAVISVQAQYTEPGNSRDWRVKISCDTLTAVSTENDPLGALLSTGGMIFPYLPQIQMSHSANYSQMDIAHLNYPFFAYKNSQVDEINITGKFTVQNRQEAQYWIGCVHFLRAVTKSFFGTGAYVGNPPPICKLNGYGDFVYNNVSIIVKNFTVTMPNDVDYIEATVGGGQGLAGANSTYVPVSSDISVTVQPVYSRSEIKTFDLASFATGELLMSQSGSGWI